MACDGSPPNCYLPREIWNNPLVSALVTSSLEMVPVISFLGSQEGQKARHPEAGWQVAPLTGDNPIGCFLFFSLLPVVHQACLLSQHLSFLVCILCSSVLAADPSSSFFFILIFGFCSLSPHTWQNSAHWWWPGCVTLLNPISPWPFLTQTVQLSGFHSVSGGIVILALQLSISQFSQFSEPWLSPDHVLYSAKLSGLAQFSDPLPDLRSHFCWHLASLPFHSILALTCRSSCRYTFGNLTKRLINSFIGDYSSYEQIFFLKFKELWKLFFFL